MTVSGCDVSFWQGVINWTKLSSKVQFTYIRAGQGGYPDQCFGYNWQAAKTAGVRRGAYYYLNLAQPVEQAQHFVKLLGSDLGELTPAIDFERYLTPTPTLSALGKFVVEFERLTGKIMVLYTNPDTWQTLGNGYEWWSRFPLWLAHHDVTTPKIPKPWASWTFWQYHIATNGADWGVQSAGLDLDYYAGAFEPPAPPPPTIEERLTSLEAWAATMGYKAGSS